MLCPKTLKPCVDDVCHGSGCLAYPGAGIDMIPQCQLCGAPLMDNSGEPILSALICDECVENNEWEDFDDDEQDR